MTGSLIRPTLQPANHTRLEANFDLPDTVLEDAQANFLRAINIWALESRGHDNLAVASLVLAAQQNNHPLTMDETCNLWNDASDSDKIKKSFGKNAQRPRPERDEGRIRHRHGIRRCKRIHSAVR